MMPKRVRITKRRHESKNLKEIKENNKEDVKEKKALKKVCTLLSSADRIPLYKWSKYIKNGFVKRRSDSELEGKVIELSGNPNQVWIHTPRDKDQIIGSAFNWLYMIIKPVSDKPLSINIQIADSTSTKRLFKLETKTTQTKLRHNVAWLSLNLRPGFWNFLEFDLANLVQRNYSTRFMELIRLQIAGNCKLTRVFMASANITQDELPKDYRLCYPHNTPDPTNFLLTE